MLILPAQTQDKEIWNSFVSENYPPIGAFMASWEWGVFQQALGRKIDRYFITAENKTVGAFTVVHCQLPLGQQYGYAPRGPVLNRDFFNTPEKINNLFKFIERWAKQNFPGFIFLRLEPPLGSETIITTKGLIRPDYYIQPRRNLAINLNKTENEILAEFHSSTRSNVKKAERKGVTAEIKKEMSPDGWNHFFKMADETMARNEGKNIYPGRAYFETMLKTVPYVDDARDGELSLGFFCGRHEGRMAAMNLVLFFGRTATYLFGGSYTAELSSKVTTYLHWRGMEEAKKRGYKYYDLGGIDEKLWPSLTVFKRRFKGEEFEYLGNIDVVLNPLGYWVYNIIRRIRKSG
ncbi:MAG: peptidoglycan bridge formation glycyltransferase FemA/FemB family protein [Parcubacteria group bacterium]|nr:peptidoglycan bridge formation glycyltransferase FemA/FemB family protein [Parcubacteria group bacterium]